MPASGGPPPGGFSHSTGDSALILVVDPDRDMRTILSLFLGAAGHDVVTAADADAALERARCLAPAVIVGENPLRLQDGATLSDALRADPVTSTIPFVVVTANARPVEVDPAGQVHEAVFVKPPVFAELVRTVDRLARQREHVLAGT